MSIHLCEAMTCNATLFLRIHLRALLVDGPLSSAVRI